MHLDHDVLVPEDQVLHYRELLIVGNIEVSAMCSINEDSHLERVKT